MKKFFAIAALAASALVANAQDGAPLYATGNFQASNWNPIEPVEFVYADGAYTLTIEGVSSFKLSNVLGVSTEDDKGGWNTFNSGAISCGKISKEQEGVALPLTPGDSNIDLPFESDWTFVVAGDLSTITATAATKWTAPVVYFRGDMNSWNAVEEWQFTELNGEDGIYGFACAEGQEVAPGEGFKFADANWGSVNIGMGDGDAIVFDAECPLTGSNNIILDEAFTGVCYLNINDNLVFFSNDPDAECPFGDYKVTAAVAGINADANQAPVYFNLQGVRVAEPQNGLYIVVKGNKAQKVLVK